MRTMMRGASFLVSVFVGGAGSWSRIGVPLRQRRGVLVDTLRAAVPGFRHGRFRLHGGLMDNGFAFAVKSASFHCRFRL